MMQDNDQSRPFRTARPETKQPVEKVKSRSPTRSGQNEALDWEDPPIANVPRQEPRSGPFLFGLVVTDTN